MASMRFPVLLPLALLLAIGLASARADPSPSDSPMRAPMRFVHVHASNRECQPYCPEWISAEGKIELGTAQIFADVIASLGGRRLPIVVNSAGGSVVDAARMGRLIRAESLAVVV